MIQYAPPPIYLYPLAKNEPFGLSILEAMAAGQCVLIPADGAYWDQVLTNHIDCLKYKPDNPSDLKQKLIMLTNDMPLIAQLGGQAAKVALLYRASKQYKNIVDTLSALSDKASNEQSMRRTLL